MTGTAAIVLVHSLLPPTPVQGSWADSWPVLVISRTPVISKDQTLIFAIVFPVRLSECSSSQSSPGFRNVNRWIRCVSMGLPVPVSHLPGTYPFPCKKCTCCLLNSSARSVAFGLVRPCQGRILQVCATRQGEPGRCQVVTLIFPSTFQALGGPAPLKFSGTM